MKRFINFFSILPQANSAINVFNQINNIEVECEEKLEAGVLTSEECYVMLNGFALAKNLSKQLDQILNHYITVSTAAHNYSADWSNFSNQKLLMMQNILTLENKVKNLILTLASNKVEVKTPTLLESILPSVQSYITITSAEIRNQLKDEVDETTLTATLRKNAAILSEHLYSDEVNSSMVKKFNGMSEHYYEVLKENEALHHSVEETMREQKTLSSNLSHKIDKLKAENAKLQSQIAEVSHNNRQLKATIAEMNVKLQRLSIEQTQEKQKQSRNSFF